MEDQDFAWFVKRIKEKTAIDLALYKEAQMKRRLTTLRSKHGYPTFKAYMEALQGDAKLMHEFLDRMTINVSEFWRNPSRWVTLEQRFMPELLRDNARPSIWSAACSTGEEPYTLAMILDKLGVLGRSTLLATDLDSNVLTRAQHGEYPERSVRDVPPPYMDAYFKPCELGFRVDDKLKRSVRFQQHNLLHDRFGGPFDLIVCRNVMIYFTEEAKHTLYRNFARALRPGGLLFVGSTEQIFSPAQYELESVETFFYRRKLL
ncbi:protein-glutamate O-methyltransferase CheR [Paenibacillus sp. IB182496]|uniref:protein-glutamate O-methyltransferase n=1 Tax=Paenibacillus sabuli TaxID=2772509 RepID=A0A927GRY5_9BACL|nr:protein-glutamate O-methyltransferase CheR [Paenibacillus sabuli]MBD2845162.1 protein-glutamate O-methyltransferase CheR [Paenibacillus sabuli]